MSKLMLVSILLISEGCAASSYSQGEYISRISDCVACHTNEGGEPMAGGKRFHTPVGDIFSTNITPNQQYGIGAYTYDDFEKAVRKGIAKDGHHLYPAMPYPSYAKIKDEDILALYDYFMHDVKSSSQQNKPAEIPWYLSPRWPLTIWNWIFTTHVTSYKVNHNTDDETRLAMRGKYLVEGPGHCGACHTPRGIGMQEKAYDNSSPEFLSGAMIDGWNAPSLRDINLKESEIKDLLKYGRSKHYAIAGPMSEVVTQSTQYLTDEDLEAVSLYLVNLNTKDTQKEAVTNIVKMKDSPGERTYLRYCSTCHGTEGQGTDYNVPSLVNNASITAEDPANLVKVIAFGAETPVTKGKVPYKMPAYHKQLSENELRNVVNYVRGEWGSKKDDVSQQQIKDIITHK